MQGHRWASPTCSIAAKAGNAFMRSPKSRSRAKGNRRPQGNIINRVFDSSGPEGKVRGTPQQIIEKYLTLARDATLSNDRVAAENFQQHAEHYIRLLAEAMREQEARQARQDHGQHGSGRDPSDDDDEADAQESAADREATQPDRRPRRRNDRGPFRPDAPQGGEILDSGTAEAGDLVETPESDAGTPPPRRVRATG
jgi:hypothetical protein